METLCRLQRTHKPVKPLFDRVADECDLSRPERSLAMNLIYGVLRHRQYLDLLLAELCHHPISKLDPFVHQALAIGIFQLFCLERIPDRAAVNETVNTVKCARLPKRLHGFVNGILRAAIRNRETLPTVDGADRQGSPILNHPAWLTQRWTERFGREEMERICRLNNLEPRLVLRTNRQRLDREALGDLLTEQGIAANPGAYAPQALVLPDYQGPVTELPGYGEGFFQVQDEAAQLATTLLGPFGDNGSYLDGCAGLGGKTSHLLELTAPHSARVTAVEPEPARYRMLTENIRRLYPDDTARFTLHTGSLQEYGRSHPCLFSGVLVDAPCSGTGVIGRHPDIRWNRKPEDLPRYHQEQLDLLAHAARLVAPGGLLVYATCSIEAEENQEVIKSFLHRRQDFSATDCTFLLPEAARVLIQDGCFCPHPSQSIDGFFAARLARNP